MTAVKLILYFIVLIAILFLAYYTTKLLGNGMGRKQDSGGIRVWERTAVARDSFLLVVEIQGTFMVLGVSPSGIQKICDLDTYDPTKKAETGKADIPSLTSAFAKQLMEQQKGKRPDR